MQLLHPLMQIRQLAGERDGRSGEGGIAGPAEGLGRGRHRRREAIREVPQPVRRRIQRGQDRRCGDLGPGALGDRVLEEGALAGEPLEEGRGLPGVPPRGEVVAPERVHQHQDDAAGRLEMAGGESGARGGGRRRLRRARAVAHDRSAPEPDAMRFLGGERESQLHGASRVGFEIDRRRFPPIRRGHRTKQESPRLGALRQRDREGDGRRLHGADGELEPWLRRQLELEDDGLRRARHQGLAVDLAQTVPAHSRRDRSEVLLARHQAHRLDLEGRAVGVGGQQHDVADARQREGG